VAPAPGRFYTDKDYGSEAGFNPLTEILNEGFDVISLRGQDKHVLDRGLGADAENVWDSLNELPAVYHNYGWSVLRNEFLPISSERVPGGGSWLPNYQSHLIGSGMVSARMTEWYRYHNVPLAPVWSGATLMTAHFLNEAVENNGWRNLNEDATTDLVAFDMGGILLWNNSTVQRAFSNRFVELTNWPGQPSWNPWTRTLENTGQLFILRGDVPKLQSWRWFYLFGMSGAGGVSRRIGNGYSLSTGVGFDAVENPIVDSTRNAKSATLRPKTAFYLDRNGSLLGSLSVRANRGDGTTRLIANLYPGVVHIGRASPGFWLQLPSTGGIRAGVISSWGLGLGGGTAK
jgi:hypothetical protein